MPQRFLSKLTGDWFGGCYLVSGNDGILIKQYIIDLETALLKHHITPLKYSYPDHSLAQLITDYRSSDFFSSRRCIIYRGIDDIDKINIKQVPLLFEIPNPDCLLLLVDATGLAADKDPAAVRLYAALTGPFRKQNACLEIRIPDPSAFNSYLVAEGKKIGLTLSAPVINHLVQQYGYSPSRIIPELAKFKAFIGDERTALTPEDLEKLSVSYVDDCLFAVIDTVFAKDRRAFITKFREFALQKDSGLITLVMLSMRNLLLVKYFKFLQADRVAGAISRVEEFSQAMSGRPLNYYQKKKLADYSRLEDSYLDRLEQALARLERTLKTAPEKIRATETERELLIAMR